MDAATTLTPLQSYLPGFRRRVVVILAGLLSLVDRSIARYPDNIRLWKYLYRLARRFLALMDRLAAGRPPRAPRRGPHTGGRPHPENLSRGSPFCLRRGSLVNELGTPAARCCLQLQAILTEPAAIDLLARVPEAERILRPLCRLLGLGRYDPYGPRLRRLRHPPPADPTIPAAALIGVRNYTPPGKAEWWPGARPDIWQLWYGFDDPPPEKPP